MGNPDNRELLVGFLTDMYIQQETAFRHYDSQRSTVTAISTSLSAALLGLIAFVWQENGTNSKILPVCAALILVSITGLVLVIKLFERSQVNRSLSEAYLNSLTELLGGDAEAVLGKRVGAIRYVANARRDFVESNPPHAPFEIRFPQGRRVCSKLDRAEMARRLDTHNPIEPREIVVPVHNASVRIGPIHLANRDEWKLWAYLNIFIVCIGFYLFIDAL